MRVHDATVHGVQITSAVCGAPPPTSQWLAPQINHPRRTVATQHQPFRIVLTRAWFSLCWWLVLCFHLLVGGFAVSVAVLNRYLQKDESQIKFSSLRVPVATLRLTARSFFVIAMCHLVAIYRLIRNSVRARRLTFHGPAAVAAGSSSAIVTKETKEASRFALRNKANQLYDAIVASWSEYFGSDGYFGVNGEYFEAAFTVREVVEIAMQTYQAYNLSVSVPRVWINQLAVAVIVLNCVASPFVHVVFRHQVSRQNVVHLVQDALLDFLGCVVIPMAIMLPYVAAFDRNIGYFPDKLVMDDVWFVNAIAETRQALVTSMPDYLSTILPHLSILSCLMTLKNVLRRGSTTTTASSVHSLSMAHLYPATATTTSDTVVSQLSSDAAAPSVRHVVHTTPSGRIRMAQHLTRPLFTTQRQSSSQAVLWRRVITGGLFILWGLVVVGLHWQARQVTVAGVAGCKLYLGAWHTPALACSVMTLNCHMQRIQGFANETASVLDQLDRTMLRILVFSHCPALHIPRVTTEFSRLVGLEIFNSSLVEWPSEAALREETQPEIGYLYLILTNWTTFPAGILHDQLPAQLNYFFVVANNMTELPHNIGDAWSGHDWITFALEELPFLQELPPSFCKLPAMGISVVSTAIRVLPENCFSSVNILQVSGNPLVALPENVSFDPNSLFGFAAENTKLTQLPAWLDGWLAGQPLEDPFPASLYGSPVCTDDGLKELFKDERRWNLTCTTDSNTTKTSYPWEFMLPQRRFDERPVRGQIHA